MEKNSFLQYQVGCSIEFSDYLIYILGGNILFLFINWSKTPLFYFKPYDLGREEAFFRSTETIRK
jgi:hypothetical protein